MWKQLAGLALVLAVAPSIASAASGPTDAGTTFAASHLRHACSDVHGFRGTYNLTGLKKYANSDYFIQADFTLDGKQHLLTRYFTRTASSMTLTNWRLSNANTTFPKSAQALRLIAYRQHYSDVFQIGRTQRKTVPACS